MKRRIQVPVQKTPTLLFHPAHHKGAKAPQRTQAANQAPTSKGNGRRTNRRVGPAEMVATRGNGCKEGRSPVALLLSKIQDALRESKYSELRSLSVCHSADGLHLYGRVSSFFLKQMAQEAIRPFLLGHEFANNVRVLSKPR